MKSINDRTLDLNLLRMLVALDDTRSVSLAGERLGLSQPAASNALSRLRQTLDDPLFLRSKDGMVPTGFADSILPEIRTHLGALFKTLERGAGFDPVTDARVFRLSLSGLGEAVFLPRLAVRTIQAGKGIRLVNTSTPTDMLADSLEAGEVDLAIGMVALSGRGVRSERLFNEDYVAIAGSGLSGSPPADLQALRAARLMVPAPATTFGSAVDRALLAIGLADRVVLRLGHFGALPQLLAQLDLVAVVPRQLADQLVGAGQARVLDIIISDTVSPISMVWHTRTATDPACAWLRDQVRSLFGPDHA
ncbi:LysR family transcriptional regulator [Nioella aestuarii]|uniref:LysR family transcriptional regulator n=1 Tax=Nioella aestuarii TaxID=1662864 RepID=UPI003D7FA7AC